jgi:hypothetical protein
MRSSRTRRDGAASAAHATAQPAATSTVAAALPSRFVVGLVLGCVCDGAGE